MRRVRPKNLPRKSNEKCVGVVVCSPNHHTCKKHMPYFIVVCNVSKYTINYFTLHYKRPDIVKRAIEHKICVEIFSSAFF